MTIHCILTGVCLRKTHKDALKQRQRKNTQFMSLTLIFWGAPWFPDFAFHSPVQEPLAPKLWGVCRATQPCRHKDVWGNDCLTSTCQGAAEKGGIPEDVQHHNRGPRQFSFLSCSQAGHVWKAPLWGTHPGVGAFCKADVLHAVEKATPALGSHCLAIGWTAATEPATTVLAMTRAAAVSLRCGMEKPPANASVLGSNVWMHFIVASSRISVPSWPLVLPSKSL